MFFIIFLFLCGNVAQPALFLSCAKGKNSGVENDFDLVPAPYPDVSLIMQISATQ